MAFESVRRIERHLEQEEEKRFIADIARLQERPELTDFSDVFDPEEIKRDQVAVERVKALFSPEDKESHELSVAMEVLLSEMIESHNWLGENVYLTPTTEYDDIVNPYIRADAVAEIDLETREVGHMALSLDATVATRSLTMRRKIYGNIARVLSTDPLKIKYFRSQVNNFIGSIEDTIPIVVGLDRSHLGEVIEQFHQLVRLQGKLPGKLVQSSEVSLRERRRLLAEIPQHPAQLVLLLEVQAQLELFRDELTRLNEPKLQPRLAQVKKIHQYINETLKQKSEIKLGALQEDSVMKEIDSEIREYRAGR